MFVIQTIRKQTKILRISIIRLDPIVRKIFEVWKELPSFEVAGDS
jgi:hypothetical protein